MNVLKSVNIIYFRKSYGYYLALGISSVAMTNDELVQNLNVQAGNYRDNISILKPVN